MVFVFFFIQFLTLQILISVLKKDICIHKKVIKVKQRKAEYPFVDKALKYELTKRHKS